MVYSEDDVKKAVEAARKLIEAEVERFVTPPYIRLLDLTPEAFYAKVLEQAKKDKGG